MRRLLLAVLLSLPCVASAAVVTTETPYTAMLGMQEIKFAWTTSALGVASGATAAAYIGEIAGAYTVYSAAALPSNNFELSVKDSRGVDVLLDAGSNVTVGSFNATDGDGEGYGYGEGLGTVAGSILTIYVRDAGATKSAVTYVFVRQR